MEIVYNHIEPRLMVEIKGFKPRYFVRLAGRLLVDESTGSPKYDGRRILEVLNLNFSHLSEPKIREIQDFIAYYSGFSNPHDLWKKHYRNGRTEHNIINEDRQ